MEILEKYFPGLTPDQHALFDQLPALYQDWNAKINVVSRKDIDALPVHHVLHSLAIAKVVAFKPFSAVLDIGTGGGFPGIPLAIMFPQVDFLLVDSIGKKIKVVEEVVAALGLKNVRVQCTRAEQVAEEFDFIVSRAVAPLADLKEWASKKVNKSFCHDLRNGILCLKGGDLTEELSAVKPKARIYPISEYFSEDYFDTKQVVYLPMI